MMHRFFPACVLVLLVGSFLVADVVQPGWQGWRTGRRTRIVAPASYTPANVVPILIQAHNGPTRIVVPRNLFPRAKPFASRLGTGAVAVAALLPLAFCLRRRGRALLLVGVLLLASNAVVPVVGANPVVPGEPLSPVARQLKERPRLMRLDGVAIEIAETGDRIVVQVPREKIPAGVGR